MNPVKIIIVGAGNRGEVYSTYASEFPELAQVVAVADLREFHRNKMAKRCNIPAENIFTDWREIAKLPKFADAVVVATHDQDHMEPAVTFANMGYHILVEKPMATTEEDCRKIVQAAIDNNVMLAVGHVLRYTPETRAVKELIDSGAIGEIVNIQRLEPVGYWHQAHSYVRGTWRKEETTSFMLMSKSCHDMDWIRYIMGNKCVSVSSFGNLKHFRKEEKPEGAGDRCIDCAVEPTCPYSAKRFYLGRLEEGERLQVLKAMAPELTHEAVWEGLREGPYGRCVYECDNDVVDHQVVNMLFENGQTCSFTMTAFNKGGQRETRIFGTHGDIYAGEYGVRLFDFLTNTTREVELPAIPTDKMKGHGGGDYGIMKDFVEAIAHNDPTRILSGPDETLESHLITFAAETARKENRVVQVKV